MSPMRSSKFHCEKLLIKHIVYVRLGNWGGNKRNIKKKRVCLKFFLYPYKMCAMCFGYVSEKGYSFRKMEAVKPDLR